MTTDSSISKLPIRVYYEDTDCGNVVYYANYLKYMERGRTEYLRDRGLDLDVFHQQGVVFVVTEAHLKYRASAHYNDLLTVETRIQSSTAVSIVFLSDVYNQAGILLVQGTVKLACISSETKKARRLPSEFSSIQ